MNVLSLGCLCRFWLSLGFLCSGGNWRQEVASYASAKGTTCGGVRHSHLNNWSRLIVLDELEQLRLVARFFLGVDQRQVFEDEALTWVRLPTNPIASLQGASPVLKRLADEQLDAELRRPVVDSSHGLRLV